MFNYHRILFLYNKNKYIGLIVILMISALILVSAIQSFIEENTGLPNLFIVAVLQILLLIQYLFIRLLYRNELISINRDNLHLFVIKTSAKQKLFLNKFRQIVIIYSIQYIFSLIAMLIIRTNLEVFILAGISIFTGFVIVMLIYLIDYDLVNERVKSEFEIFIQVGLLGLGIALFYFPSIKLLTICCGVVLIVIGVKTYRIWGELS